MSNKEAIELIQQYTVDRPVNSKVAYKVPDQETKERLERALEFVYEKNADTYKRLIMVKGDK